MATKLVNATQLDSDLTTVANAIRTKGGTSAQLSFPSGMAQAISDIQTGITPTGTTSITENGTYDVTQYASANVNVSGGGSLIEMGTTYVTSYPAAGEFSIYHNLGVIPKLFFMFKEEFPTSGYASLLALFIDFNKLFFGTNATRIGYFSSGSVSINSISLPDENPIYYATNQKIVINITPNSAYASLRPGNYRVIFIG